MRKQLQVTEHCQEVRTGTRLNSSAARPPKPGTYSHHCNFHFSYKPLSKQKPDEDLKDKNELLEAVNKQLHQKLTETQVRRSHSLTPRLPLVTQANSMGGSRQEKPAPVVALLPLVGRLLTCRFATPQGELKDLTQKVELLEKFQDNCLAILESKGLNSGKRRTQGHVGSKGSLLCVCEGACIAKPQRFFQSLLMF